MIITENDCVIYNDSLFYCISPEHICPQWIRGCIAIKDVENKHFYDYLVREGNNFKTKALECKPTADEKFFDNYNSDFPHQNIIDFLSKTNESGLVILHGEPGTGKTTYIRHLINSGEFNFIYCDQSVFQYFTDISFINFLMDNKDAVLILEDCEAILKDRNTSGNTQLAALLNITDGLLADSLNLKMICTFNADIHTLDKALLRKGRLKLKYEFKKLNKINVERIAKAKNIELTGFKDMTLADLYNPDNNIINNPEKKRIGF